MPGVADVHHEPARPGVPPGQLAFAASAALALYVMFVLTQTVRHRDFFLPIVPEVAPAESLAAARAARRERIQISLNLAYGSAIASTA